MSAYRVHALALVLGASTLGAAQSLPIPIPLETAKEIAKRVSNLRKFESEGLTTPPPKVEKTEPEKPPQTVQQGVIDLSDQPKNPTDDTSPSRPKSWLERQVVDKVEIRGQRRIGYHSHTVEGDFDAYSSLNYYGRGGSRFTDFGNMTVSGRNVLGFLTFDLNYSSDQFNDPESQRVTFSYGRGPWKVSAGDITGRLLNTNPFATFSRSLRGASAEYRAGRFQARALHSEARGGSRTVSLEGNNSAGPYYLQSGRVIPDSVQVRIDDVPMRLMDDYVVNADIGTITFVNRIVAPTSTIVITYESYGFSTSGTIQGGAMTYDLGQYGRLGLIGMEQRAGLTGSNTIVQRYFGFGSAAAQYWLDFEPAFPTDPNRFVVKVDGLVQTLGIDYYFDPSTFLVFYFTRPIGTTQQIDVVYVPKSNQNLDGDRRVWGFDYRIPIGRAEAGNYVQYSQASGQLINEQNPMKGTAKGLDGQYKLGDFILRGSVKDIPRDYVTVQSIGFQRNERSTQLGLDWVKDRYTASVGYSNSSISNPASSSTSQSQQFIDSRFTRATAGLNYAAPDGTSWNVSHSRVRSRRTDESELDTTSAGGRRRWGRLDFDTSVQYQSGYGPITSENETKPGSLSLQTYGIGAKYGLGDGLNLTGRASVSKIRALEKEGDGSDVSLGLAYQPSEGRFRANVTYASSDSGQIATLGSDFSGYGYGYGGNGFSGGGLGSGGFTAGETSVRAMTANAFYQATKRLSLNVHALSSSADGALTSNAKNFAYGVGFEYDLGNFNQLGISLDKSRTDFLSSDLRSETVSLDAYLNGAPAGPWSYRLGLSQFLSQGGLYSQDSFSIDAYLGYKLTPRQRLSIQYRNGRTTGYYPQDENLLYAGYEYQLFRNVALVGSYKWRNVKNLNPDATSGAYRSNGFDIELSFDFR